MNSIVPKDWTELPDQCSLQVFGHLSPLKAGTCSLVCKKWNQFLNSNYVWQKLSRDHFPSTPLEVIKSFREYVNLGSNLPEGVCSMKTIQEDKMVHAICSLAVQDGKLFSGSDDHTIKIWDLRENTCTATFRGHLGQVNFLVVEGEKLFSSSDDNTIKVWDLRTKTCVAILEGHTSMVGPLAVEGEELFSGSMDKTIKIWDLRNNTCKATLEGHEGNVNFLVKEGEKLFSSCSDGWIRIWDLATRTCTATFWSGASRFILDGRKLFAGCWDKTIRVWDLETSTCTVSLLGHNETPRFLNLNCGKLFSGSADQKIKMWDLETLTNIATLDAGPIYSLAASNGRVFSGSNNSTIKIWDFTASHPQIFTEIADALENQDKVKIEFTMERFLKMPKAARNKIYNELYKIIKPQLKHNYWGCGEHAFHGTNRQSATGAQKAQAIRNYLSGPALLPNHNGTRDIVEQPRH